MSAPAFTSLQQSAFSLPGTWRLDAARAVTLRPREDGVLRVAHGSVWLTFDGPHGGPPNEQGDRFLGAGEQVPVRAGQRLVLESADRRAPVYFTWDFAPQAEAVRVPRMQAVAQSWADLRLAAALAGRAAGRLGLALVRLGAGSVLPRPTPARRATC